jgi:hypothetical protein
MTSGQDKIAPPQLTTSRARNGRLRIFPASREFGCAETGSLETAPSSGESDELRTADWPTEQGVGYQAGLSLASAMTFSYLAVRHMLETK